MPRHHVERVLAYAPEQLFELVGDVARYPEFVPWITSMRTGPVTAPAPDVTSIDAEAGVGFSFLQERFATRVRRDAAQRRIEVSLLRGPFRRLENRWQFEPDPGGTRVVFDIDFAFKTRLLDALLVANFDRAVGKLIACFEGRAAALYGTANRSADPVADAEVVAPT